MLLTNKNMKRLNTVQEAYNALHDALDLVKGIQSGCNPKTMSSDRRFKVTDRAWKALAEARAALDTVASEMEDSLAGHGPYPYPRQKIEASSRPDYVRMWWRGMGKAHLVPADGSVRTLCGRDACTPAWSEASDTAKLCPGCGAAVPKKS